MVSGGAERSKKVEAMSPDVPVSAGNGRPAPGVPPGSREGDVPSTSCGPHRVTSSHFDSCMNLDF
jgi:hypothetical protein